jgi:hypothetical protein
MKSGKRNLVFLVMRSFLHLPQVKIAPLGEVGNLAVSDGTFEHPEPTVGVDEFYAAIPKCGFGFLDRFSNLIGSLNVVNLDINNSQTDADLGANFLEGLKVVLGPMGQFEDEVVSVQGVEKFEERFPFSGLDGLTAIVTETEVYRGRAIESIKHAVNSFGRKRAILGIARDVGFINLEARAGKVLHLIGKNIGNGKSERFEITVMIVEESSGQHVGASHGKLKSAPSHAASTAAIFDKVEPTSTKGLSHYGGGLGAEAHFLLGAKSLGISAADD